MRTLRHAPRRLGRAWRERSGRGQARDGPSAGTRLSGDLAAGGMGESPCERETESHAALAEPVLASRSRPKMRSSSSASIPGPVIRGAAGE